MHITTYISELLYRYECVILPGFGAFLTQRHSASLNLSNNKFYPPKKTVSFNSQLKKNDGLLANHLVAIEKISYEKAVDKLNYFVQELQLVLDKNKAIHLANIGSLSLSEEGKLQFEPLAETNYLKEAFGLASFSSEPVLRENYKKQAAEWEEKTPIVFTPESKAIQPYLKYAAIGLFVLGLSGFTGMNFYSNQVKEQNLIAQEKANFQLEGQIQRATFVIENPLPAITLKVAKQAGKYHIVAGAFREMENAEKKVEQLKEEGFLARKMKENRYGLHQVVYSSYESRREAINALKKIKHRNPGAWLLVQE